MTAPRPKLAESESWAMLPTLATMSMPSAGQAIVAVARIPPAPSSVGSPVTGATPSVVLIGRSPQTGRGRRRRRCSGPACPGNTSPRPLARR